MYGLGHRVIIPPQMAAEDFSSSCALQLYLLAGVETHGHVFSYNIELNEVLYHRHSVVIAPIITSCF